MNKKYIVRLTPEEQHHLEELISSGKAAETELITTDSLLEVAAWEAQRHTKGSKVDWRFTTVDARIKLKRLYPSIQT